MPEPMMTPQPPACTCAPSGLASPYAPDEPPLGDRHWPRCPSVPPPPPPAVIVGVDREGKPIRLPRPEDIFAPRPAPPARMVLTTAGSLWFLLAAVGAWVPQRWAITRAVGIEGPVARPREAMLVGFNPARAYTPQLAFGRPLPILPSLPPEAVAVWHGYTRAVETAGAGHTDPAVLAALEAEPGWPVAEQRALVAALGRRFLGYLGDPPSPDVDPDPSILVR